MCDPQTDSCIYPEKPRTLAALRRQDARGGECVCRFSRSAAILVRLQQQWMPGAGCMVGIASPALHLFARSFTHDVNKEV